MKQTVFKTMDMAAPASQVRPGTPSILSANWLYLISMLLIISVGTILQNASFGWGLLGTELLLILLPTWVFLRLKRLPLAETLRLHWPGWAVMTLGLVAGAGLWLVGVTLDAYMVTLFGYTTPTPPDAYPVTIGQAVLVFVALAISAPLGEETMFRGYIQGAYEARGRRPALVIASLLFVFFHFRLQGLVGLLPVAFGLGYLRMRSDSLWPAVAAHLSNNAIAALFLILAGLQADWSANVPLGSPLLALAGLAVLLVALWLFGRLAASDNSVTAVPAPTLPEASRFSGKAILPLGMAALLYLGLAGFEFVYGRMPELTTVNPLSLGALELEQPTTWEYDIRNVLDESVGRATCRLTPAGAVHTLHCQTDVRAFKVELPGSLYQTGEFSREFTVQWRVEDLGLIAGEQETIGDDASTFWRVAPATAGLNLVTNVDGPTQTLPLPESVLLPDEWPWRLMALPFRMGLGQRANFAWPSLWQPETQSSAPAVEETAVVVYGAEPVATPAGNFIAWRVNRGRQTAWYDVNPPHTLLRYDAGFAVYVLTAVR